MTIRHLVARSLVFHWRAHLGVVLGAAVGSTALVGALLVGDSVRESLKERALERLGRTQFAVSLRDRFFGEDLPQRLARGAAMLEGEEEIGSEGWATAVLTLPGTAARQDGQARANRIQVLGISEQWPGYAATPSESSTTARQAMHPFPEDAVYLNRALADQLHAGPGDDLVVRVHKPSALSRDAVIAPRDDASLALRLRVAGILEADLLGNLDLNASQAPPLNAFVRRDLLAAKAGLAGFANQLLVAGPTLAEPDHALTRAKRWLARALPLAWRRSFEQWAFPPRSLPGPELLQRLQDSLLGNSSAGTPGAAWELGDLELTVRGGVARPDPAVTNRAVPYAELTTRRIFLDPLVGRAAVDPVLRTNRAPEELLKSPWLPRILGLTNATPILTYLVNHLAAGDRLTPYSMVTAAGPPYTPADLADDEIVVNEWLASDLGVKPGDAVQLAYYVVDSGSELLERTNRFRVRSIVPLAGWPADRTLMPEFPGLSKAESTHDWDAGFPLVHPIREKDEAYWKQYRGTPKAFVTLAAGQRLWANRFGDTTAIRWFGPELNSGAPAMSPDLAARELTLLTSLRLYANLDPEGQGIAFQPVRELALKAATSGQDFGQLFIGFSFFLVLAALLLMALLFRFGLEQRLPEVGVLLAMGFRPAAVRRLWLIEGVVLAGLGAGLGVLGALAYAPAMIRGLTTIWRDAVAGTALAFHGTPTSLIVGWGLSVGVCGATIAWTMRRQFGRPPRELLAGEIASARGSGRRVAGPLAVISSVVALSLMGWAVSRGETTNAGVFFGVGSLVLVAGLAWAAVGLRYLERGARTESLSVLRLAARGTARRRSRSLATVGLLACGAFLVSAIGAFRMDAERDAARRDSGTGGFGLIGEASLPVTQDLNRSAGQEFFGLNREDLRDVSFVPFRVRDGDEASCLNLNRAQRPRILGVDPEQLASRGAFRFASLAAGVTATNAWRALRSPNGPLDGVVGEIPAIGDAASIQWALGKKVGDTLEMTDERGRPLRLRLVAGVANSILQGNLVIDESAFRRVFPGESGHRFFLVDVPTNRVTEVSARLTRALQDSGLEWTPAPRRLAQFLAVQNTYLGTFQVLGGLGLLLGSAGLGVVVLRNVLERRGELALLTAVGLARSRISRLVLVEHATLLCLGLGLGLASAGIAVLPSLLAPEAELPARSLAGTLAGTLLFGFVTTWAATRASLRGRLLDALRGE